MPDLSKFKTAHQLARELLAGPDIIVTLPVPAFDSPGVSIAYPVSFKQGKVGDTDVILLRIDVAALPKVEIHKSDEPKDKVEPEGGAH